MKKYYFFEDLNGGFNPTDKYRNWLRTMNITYETFEVSSFIFKNFADETVIYITYSLSGDEGMALFNAQVELDEVYTD